MAVPPFHWWRTVFFLIPAIALYTIVLGTLSLLSTLVDRQGHLAHRCARAWAWLILKTTGVTVDIQGLDDLPRDQPYLFLANHQSIYDIPVLFWHLPYQVRILAKASLGKFPFLGGHLRRSGHVLVDRSNPGNSTMAQIKELMRQKVSLVVFPEGTRSADGSVAPIPWRHRHAGHRGRAADRAGVGGGDAARDAEGAPHDLPRSRPRASAASGLDGGLRAGSGARTGRCGREAGPRRRRGAAGADPVKVEVSPLVAEIVAPAIIVRHGVTVHAHDARLDAPLAAAAEALRSATGLEEAMAATRTMYKRCGIDPTKTRPSSEALLRRVRKGEPLPRVNGLVDIINWCSAETQISFGLYDLSRIAAADRAPPRRRRRGL